MASAREPSDLDRSPEESSGQGQGQGQGQQLAVEGQKAVQPCPSATIAHPDMQLWRDRVQDFYPNLFSGHSYLPPVFMHRTQYRQETVSGTPVLVLEPPSNEPRRSGVLLEVEVKEDQAQQKVLTCLQRLPASEVMFVISQLKFGDYLNKPAFAAAAALLTRATDPVLMEHNKHRGDFDVLVLLRDYGVVAGEIKSIGANLVQLGLTDEEQDSTLIRTVKQKAVGQMHKSRDVLTHLLPEYKSGRPMIRPTLMLPNVSASQLQRALAANPPVREALCLSLCIDVTEDPVTYCLTSDVLDKPDQWWQKRVTATKDPAMSDEVYLDLVSRFAGPATTVTVHCSTEPRLSQAQCKHLRTPGEGVAETANRFAPVDLVLTPTQVEILNDETLRLVWLNGPPGCGKTLVIVLKVREWLRLGKEVHVVSTWHSSLAVSEMIVSQLQRLAVQQTAEPASRGVVTVHTFDLYKAQELQRAVFTLSSADRDGEGQLFVVFDEPYTGNHFTMLCTELTQSVPGLHLWAASNFHMYRPPVLCDVNLTEPLRTPPSVTRLVQECNLMQPGRYVYGYTVTAFPLPDAGPPPIVVEHSGPGHSSGDPQDCVQCGRETATILLEKLHVGRPARGPGSPQLLSFRDVFVLGFAAELHDCETDATRLEATRAASGLLTGLREAGIPVTVLKDGDVLGARQVANMSGPDQAVAAHCTTVSGLERKVVVFVQAGYSEGSVDESDGKHLVMSRTTAQMIWVRPPPERGQ